MIFLLLGLIIGIIIGTIHALGWECDGIDKDSYDVCTKSGDCISLDDCDCYAGTNGDNCENKISIGCADGYYGIDPDCDGWFCYTYHKLNLGACSTNGVCSSPENCTCDSSDYEYYYGDECQLWNCYDIIKNESLSVCSGHGTCVSPNNCSCNYGYAGYECEVELEGVCDDIISCDPSCLNGGICIATNFCNCTSHWSGVICDIPVCDPKCGIYGTCNDSQICDCESGWSGEQCDIPICDNPECTLGACISPNTCKCPLGYWGDSCNKSIAYTCFNFSQINYGNVCSGHGNCVGENTCECQDNYFGDECQITLSCYGINFDNASYVCSGGDGDCIGEDICRCHANYEGSQCEIRSNTTTCFGIKSDNFTYVCNGEGICISEDVCVCNISYSGLECKTFNAPTCNDIIVDDENIKNACDMRGLCIKSLDLPESLNYFICKCDQGYQLIDGHCILMRCNGIPWNSNWVCSGNGNCEIPSEVCKCDVGWVGEDCEIPLCDYKSNDDSTICNGKGKCIAPDLCNCTENGFGSFISSLCAFNITPSPHNFYCKDSLNGTYFFYNKARACGDHGECTAQDKCLCDPLYYGSVCQYEYNTKYRIKYWLHKKNGFVVSLL